EAVAKVIDYGLQHLKLKMIVAGVHPDNLKSIQLLKRNGFAYAASEAGLAIYELNNSKTG
ncbi:MAG TPA: GNAT family N-acetyltransferase, partial [Chitinophagales bacterium]|nr:GNAT family N-acetyltransferase [Chitinophagales bacterium]